MSRSNKSNAGNVKKRKIEPIRLDSAMKKGRQD
jgi:hypothetical protein